ncbi:MULTISPECIES: hypothetical protein [unclassified Streptomyces]|uniref:hypothetical protein n=1 Tax=unclassified Streptomyces TaxID=2593676 RepID=UPI00166125B3|nr:MULTISPECIES: hypothetical protein [unclassified Streptomyces]MBD0710930.1 hypothetical protein [Streptomyces sp. CBMA291]MBD0717349.1 hypothetical protein [Streptomyces sp. CBMA370]
MRFPIRSKSLAALAMAASALGVASLALAPQASATATANGWSLCRDYNLQHCNWWSVGNDPYSPDLGKWENSSSGVEYLQDAISSIQIQNAKTLYTWNDNNFTGIQGVFQNNFTWNTLNYPYNDTISSIRTWS